MAPKWFPQLPTGQKEFEEKINLKNELLSQGFGPPALTVWQVKELPNLHGTGTSLLSGFFDTVANVYTLVQPEVNVSYVQGDGERLH